MMFGGSLCLQQPAVPSVGTAIFFFIHLCGEFLLTLQD